jgi:hypothetical protein
VCRVQGATRTLGVGEVPPVNQWVPCLLLSRPCPCRVFVKTVTVSPAEVRGSDLTEEDVKEWVQKSQKKKEEAVAQKVTEFFNSCKLQWSVTNDDQGLKAWIMESALRNVEVGRSGKPDSPSPARTPPPFPALLFQVKPPPPPVLPSLFQSKVQFRPLSMCAQTPPHLPTLGEHSVCALFGVCVER